MRLEALEQEGGDPMKRLRKGLERYVAFGLNNPNHYVPAFILPHPEGVLEAAQQAQILAADSASMRALGCLRRALADAMTAQKIRKGDPDVMARAWWTALHGVTSAMIIHHNFPWGDRQAVIDTLIDGLIASVKTSVKK